MCFNAKVSISIFLISLLVLLSVFYKVYFLKGNVGSVNYDNIIVFTAFILSIIVIQFIEYKLWNSQDNISDNMFWSKIAFVIILLQPLMSLLRTNDKTIRNKLIIAYILFVILTFLLLLPSRVFQSYKGEDGHLNWKWLELKGIQYTFMIGWMLLFFSSDYFNGTLTSSIPAILAMLILFYYYIGSWASLWCLVANIISIYYLYLLITGK